MLIIYWVYRYFFEFKNEEVSKLINTEAANFKPNDANVASILHDSVMHILGDRSLTNMVTSQAKATGLPKEKILVDAAIGLAQSQKYIT
jgi:hypothetical protein